MPLNTEQKIVSLQQTEELSVDISSNDKLQESSDLNNSSGDVILGDLLCYLREGKLMSTLMICRQIEKIEIKGDVCVLSGESSDIEELIKNEKHRIELDKFFKSKGLGFKVEEKLNVKSKTELLREFFGDKLNME